MSIDEIMGEIMDANRKMVVLCQEKTPEEIARVAAMLVSHSYRMGYHTVPMAVLYEILCGWHKRCIMEQVQGAWVEVLGMLCFGLYNENNAGCNPFEWRFTRAFDDPYAMEIAMLFKNNLPEECNQVDHNIQCIKKKFVHQ